MLRVRARRTDVVRKGEVEEEATQQVQKPQKGKLTLPPVYESPGIEMDMRGQRVDEGLDALDRYLEKAYLAGLPFVHIIHGKGTGRLRESVREALVKSPFVDRFEGGGSSEGGEGVTVAHIKRS
jgi:DNA mismatch repair protein MutS2